MLHAITDRRARGVPATRSSRLLILAVITGATTALTACGGGSEPDAVPEATPGTTVATVVRRRGTGRESLCRGRHAH